MRHWPSGDPEVAKKAIEENFGKGAVDLFDKVFKMTELGSDARKGVIMMIAGAGNYSDAALLVKKKELEAGSPDYQRRVDRAQWKVARGFNVIDGKPVGPPPEGSERQHARPNDANATEQGRHDRNPLADALQTGLDTVNGGVGDSAKHIGKNAAQVMGDKTLGNKIAAGVLGLREQIVQNVGSVLETICGKGQVGNNCGSKDPAAPLPPTPGNQEGQGHLQQGKPEQAYESFNQALKEEPFSLTAMSGRAQASYQMGDYAAASRDAQAVLDIRPDDKAAFSILKLSENRAPQSAPASASADAFGGSAVSDSGMFVGAGSGAAALKLDMTKPESVQSAAQVKLAEKAMRMGDSGAAYSYASRAIELNPKNGLAYFYRSAINGPIRRDFAAALADADAGLALAPANPALLNAKAFALNRLGRFQDALAASETALRINSRDASALANRAYALGGLGDRAAMLENLRLAAAVDPRFQSSLDSALQMPSDSDLLFLFPGEARPADLQSGAVPERKSGRRLRTLGLAVLGVLLAVGLFAFATGGRRDAAVPRSAAPAPAPGRPAAIPVSEGTLLRGKYEIVRQIGAGGMGVVFEGMDVSLKRKVAIKKMREEIRLDRKERERFLAEAKTVAALHHPNVVDIYAIVEADEDVYLVFEFVSGGTLHARVSEGGAMPLSKAVPVFQGIAAALEAAHGRGIIHRDLKPSNIMIDDEGGVKVMDFGVARVAKDAAVKFSMTNTVMGTPPYMAPEQESGVVRKESDVYSMAVCLYEVLTGRQPFAGMGAGMLLNKMNMSFVPATKAAPGLAPAMDAVFAKAFAADPEKRYSCAGELMKAVEAAAETQKA
ncbi:MAG: protein kinase [Elusimicrobiota bacterium]|jgi:serine/threonine-protein kinase